MRDDVSLGLALLRIIGNVSELIPVILGSGDAARMIPGMPNLAGPPFAHGKGISTFD
jgi:hypothetical protein